MNTITIHCAKLSKAAIEAALVPKPPVDIVVKAWVIESNTPISVKERRVASATVNPRYTNQRRFAVSRKRGVNRSGDGPGDSARASCTPPVPNNGKMAIESTMIPIPPIHWVKARHHSTPCPNAAGSGIIEDPVVVIPAAVSKKASVIPLTEPVTR